MPMAILTVSCPCLVCFSCHKLIRGQGSRDVLCCLKAQYSLPPGINSTPLLFWGNSIGNLSFCIKQQKTLDFGCPQYCVILCLPVRSTANNSKWTQPVDLLRGRMSHSPISAKSSHVVPTLAPTVPKMPTWILHASYLGKVPGNHGRRMTNPTGLDLDTRVSARTMCDHRKTQRDVHTWSDITGFWISLSSHPPILGLFVGEAKWRGTSQNCQILCQILVQILCPTHARINSESCSNHTQIMSDRESCLNHA